MRRWRTPRTCSTWSPSGPARALDAASVARTLRNLHAYGASGEIVAFTRPQAGGVAVVFGLWSRIQVEEVRVLGALGLRRAQLIGALPQRQEQPLSESKVIRGVWALQDLYFTSGYRERTVRVHVDVDRARKQAVITYHVNAGPRARVGEVTFSGDTGPFDAAALRAPLRSETGRHHHELIAGNDVERLEDWLINRGFRRAAVDPPVASYDAAEDRLDLEFSVQVGPRFDIEAPGVDLKRLRRKGLLPFLETERFDETLFIQSREALRRHFQERRPLRRRGRPGAGGERQPESSYGWRSSVGRSSISTAVRFQGNETFGEERLAELMETSVARRLGSGGRLVDEIVDDDLANIRSFYALQGFAEAEVGPVGRRAARRLPRAGGADRRGAAAAGRQRGVRRHRAAGADGAGRRSGAAQARGRTTRGCWSRAWSRSGPATRRPACAPPRSPPT